MGLADCLVELIQGGADHSFEGELLERMNKFSNQS